MTDSTTPQPFTDAISGPSSTATNDSSTPPSVANAVVAAIPLSSTFKTFAAALLPFLVLVVGGLQSVLDNPHAATVIPFLVLLLNGFIPVVPLLPSGWRGAFKTGIPIVTTILAAVATYAIAGTLTWSNATIVIVGVLTALATELGVAVRTSKSDLALAA